MNKSIHLPSETEILNFKSERPTYNYKLFLEERNGELRNLKFVSDTNRVVEFVSKMIACYHSS